MYILVYQKQIKTHKKTVALGNDTVLRKTKMV